jgi:hypothetical protein
VDTRASRSTGSGQAGRLRAVRTATAVMAAVAVLAIQPTPARADTFATNFFPAHWGPNQHLTVATNHPYYKSVAVIDNTGDPSLSQHIQTFAQIINALHNGYNTNYPVILYYQNIAFAPGQPCALGPPQFLVLCKDETLGGTGSPSAPGSAAIFPGPAPANHIFYAIGRFRPSLVDPMCSGDKFRLVVQIFSNTLGLDYNLSNGASAMFPTIPLGGCGLVGWTQAELDRMNLMYNHAVG